MSKDLLYYVVNLITERDHRVALYNVLEMFARGIYVTATLMVQIGKRWQQIGMDGDYL